MGVFAFALTLTNIFPVNDFTVNGIQIGSAFEVIILSLALADKINILRKQNLLIISELKNSNLDLKNEKLKVTELNKNLESRVIEKTRDITAILQNIPAGIFMIEQGMKITF